jgi:hypothetical protein
MTQRKDVFAAKTVRGEQRKGKAVARACARKKKSMESAKSSGGWWIDER